MTKKITDLPEKLFAEEDDIFLLRDASAGTDKQIKVENLSLGSEVILSENPPDFENVLPEKTQWFTKGGNDLNFQFNLDYPNSIVHPRTLVKDSVTEKVYFRVGSDLSEFDPETGLEITSFDLSGSHFASTNGRLDQVHDGIFYNSNWASNTQRVFAYDLSAETLLWDINFSAASNATHRDFFYYGGALFATTSNTSNFEKFDAANGTSLGTFIGGSSNVTYVAVSETENLIYFTQGSTNTDTLKRLRTSDLTLDSDLILDGGDRIIRSLKVFGGEVFVSHSSDNFLRSFSPSTGNENWALALDPFNSTEIEINNDFIYVLAPGTNSAYYKILRADQTFEKASPVSDIGSLTIRQTLTSSGSFFSLYEATNNNTFQTFYFFGSFGFIKKIWEH